ncbi:ferritin-like domain-containing protein [Lactifluus volemus]|nr:ferritin-like domain-containing protein [Lactifluus volemus]
MLSFKFLAAVLVPLAVSAVPVRRGTDPSTLQVLRFATVLESLDTAFYEGLLGKFKAQDFINAGFISGDLPITELTTIEAEEGTHATALEGIITKLGDQPLSGCQFNVSSLLTDVKTAVKASRIIEQVGIGAFSGSGHLIQDPSVLTSADSILTSEARHQAITNLLNAASPSPQPFDIPLLPQEVLAMAGGLISGCDLGVKANPPLTVTNEGPILIDTILQFSSPTLKGNTSDYFCQLLTGDMANATVLPFDDCPIPATFEGPAFAFITSNNQPLSGDVIVRQTQNSTVVAGPTILFVDSLSDPIAQLIVNSHQ